MIAGILVVATSGCGLTMTTGPDPHRAVDQRPVCTESMDAPKRDAVPAALGFATVLVGLLFVKASDDQQELGAALMVGGGVTMVASYISGGVGYSRVKRCRRAIDDWEHLAPATPSPEPAARPAR